MENPLIKLFILLLGDRQRMKTREEVREQLKVFCQPAYPNDRVVYEYHCQTEKGYYYNIRVGSSPDMKPHGLRVYSVGIERCLSTPHRDWPRYKVTCDLDTCLEMIREWIAKEEAK